MKHYRGGFMREHQLRDLGVAAVGQNVAVHETCVLVGLEAMRFGSNVRVDPFTVLSAAGGSIAVGDFVHVGSQVFISADSGVEIGDFVSLSPGAKLFARSDDFTGDWLTNPTVPAEFTRPRGGGPIRIGRHAMVGAGSILLPEVRLDEGTAVGAASLVVRNCEPWSIYAGSPARRIRDRRRDVIPELEARLRAALARGEAVAPVSRL